MATNTSAFPTVRFPILDLGPWWTGDAAERSALAAEVDRINGDTGFLVITGHGIADRCIQDMTDACMAFFDLDEQTKQVSSPADPSWSRGYRPLRSRALAYSTGKQTPPDLVEYFAAGKPDVDLDDPYYAPDRAGVHYHPNIWPALPGEFQQAWTNYYLALESLATELMRIYAVGLGLPIDWFDDKVDRHCSNLFANHYPEYHGYIEEGQLRLGAHTDYGSLTIVYQNGDVGGLQILSGGSWIDVPVIAGSFVVNIGDLLARWTNDRWTSTLHRVVNPDAGRTVGSRRLSIPYFHQPNYDTMIECIPTCLGETGPKYAPILSGVNMIEKTNSTLLS